MNSGLIAIATALVMSLSTVAPAIAQGMTASKAMEAIARQPESAGNLRSSMLVAAGMVEGAALFAIIVCLLTLFF